LDHCKWGLMKRERRAHFRRFQEAHPEFEREVTRETTEAFKITRTNDLPYDKLWETYNLMSKLVHVDDKGVSNSAEVDNRFLTR